MVPASLWRRRWDSNPRAGIAGKLISSQPRYDRFDTSPNKHIIAGEWKKSRLFGKSDDLLHFGHYALIIFTAVGDQATGAILNAGFRVCKIATAVFS